MCRAVSLRLKAGREKSFSKPDETSVSTGMMSMMRPMPRHSTIQSMMYSDFMSCSRKASDDSMHKSSEQASRAGKSFGSARSMAIR